MSALVSLEQAKKYIQIDNGLRVDAEFVAMGDGVTDTFTLDYTPVEGSLRIYVNSILTTDYTIDGNTVTFTTPPSYPITASYNRTSPESSLDDDLLEMLIEAATKSAEDYTGRAFIQREITEYHYGDGSRVLRLYKRPVISVSSVSYTRIGRSTGDGETQNFSLGNTPKPGSLIVYVDGDITTDYILDGQNVIFNSAPRDGAELKFKFEVPVTDYSEQIHVGRLGGQWLPKREYVIRYVAGYGASREEAQAIVPNAVEAVLIAVANAYENRLGLSSQNVGGVGSAAYAGLGLPDASKELLRPFITEVV